MSRWGVITARVIAHLEHYGPASVAELAAVGADRDVLRKTCARLVRTQRAHICAWVRCADGERDYPRAVYSIGPGVNKPRPRAKARKAVVADWHRNRTARQRMNFVFNLGARG